MKKLKDKYFQFNKDNTITVGITRHEYEQIEKLSMRIHKDRRCAKSILKCYAIVSLFSRLSGTGEFVPICAKIFKSNTSGSRYAEYQNFLEFHGFIETRNETIDSYTDKNGNKHTITVTPKSFRRCPDKTGILQRESFPGQDKLYFLTIAMPDNEIFVSLQQKHKAIESYSWCPNKISSIFSINDGECYMTKLIADFIQNIAMHKIKSSATFNRHIRDLFSNSKEHTAFNFNNTSDIILLIYNILKNIQEVKEREKEAEQKGETYLTKLFDFKKFTDASPRQPHNSGFSYYADLAIDCEGLGHCIRAKDLYDIANLNKIPERGKAGKIYSVFSRIRRPLRKFIRYNGEHLVEASDVHCAHYAMLPVVFRYCDISVHKDEMERFVMFTQTKDLYGETVKETGISRDAIKPVFQSFYSIKDENQYLYAGRRKGESEQRELICCFFRTNFPEIYSQMLHFHKNHDYTLKSVANMAESNIMNPICDKLISYGLHPFRLHDAIYLTTTEFEASKSLIDINEEVYGKINENFSKLF